MIRFPTEKNDVFFSSAATLLSHEGGPIYIIYTLKTSFSISAAHQLLYFVLKNTETEHRNRSVFESIRFRRQINSIVTDIV